MTTCARPSPREALGTPYEVATTRTLLAQALSEAGDEGGRDRPARHGRRPFDQIGARPTPAAPWTSGARPTRRRA